MESKTDIRKNLNIAIEGAMLYSPDNWELTKVYLLRLKNRCYPDIKGAVFDACINLSRECLGIRNWDTFEEQYNDVIDALLYFHTIPEYRLSMSDIATCLFEMLQKVVSELCEGYDYSNDRIHAIAALRAIGKYSCKWNNPHYVTFKLMKSGIDAYLEHTDGKILAEHINPTIVMNDAIDDPMFKIVSDICDRAVKVYPDTFKLK